MLREYIHEESGNKLLRLATLDEVIPNVKYYIIDPIKSNYFYETSFGSEVSWETIKEFIDTKKIYIKNEKPSPSSTGKSPLDRNEGPVQSSMF